MKLAAAWLVLLMTGCQALSGLSALMADDKQDAGPLDGGSDAGPRDAATSDATTSEPVPDASKNMAGSGGAPAADGGPSSCNLVHPDKGDASFAACASGESCAAFQTPQGSTTSCIAGKPDGTLYAMCTRSAECAAGLGCVDGRCRAWCQVGGKDCASEQMCASRPDKVMVAGVEFGMCTCANAPAGSVCGLAPQCGCPSGQMCDLANTESWDGATACFPAGTTPTLGTCAKGTDCMVGHSCFNGACHELCAPSFESLCDPGTVCAGVIGGNGAVIPGYQVCGKRGGFTDACENLRLVDTTLFADCRTANGQLRLDSTLDLDPLVTNANGTLVFAHEGGYHQTCRMTMLTPDGILQATCILNGEDAGVATELDLNTGIRNNDGVLVPDF